MLKNKSSPEPASQFQSNIVQICDPWVEGYQNCTNIGPVPLQRGDNHKNAKLG
jgi:hypothetical protein